jgi:hypothetical protein
MREEPNYLLGLDGADNALVFEIKSRHCLPARFILESYTTSRRFFSHRTKLGITAALASVPGVPFRRNGC